jgi:hypothetical protein
MSHNLWFDSKIHSAQFESGRRPEHSQQRNKGEDELLVGEKPNDCGETCNKLAGYSIALWCFILWCYFLKLGDEETRGY